MLTPLELLSAVLVLGVIATGFAIWRGWLSLQHFVNDTEPDNEPVPGHDERPWGVDEEKTPVFLKFVIVAGMYFLKAWESCTQLLRRKWKTIRSRWRG